MTKYIHKIANTEVLLQHIREAISDMVQYKSEEGIAEIYMSADDGVYAPRDFCLMFGIDKCANPDSESYWEDFDEVEAQCTDDINELLGSTGIKDEYPDFGFSIGFMEGYIGLVVNVEEGYWLEHDQCTECGEIFDTDTGNLSTHLCLNCSH
jgi:hypothetical protein